MADKEYLTQRRKGAKGIANILCTFAPLRESCICIIALPLAWHGATAVAQENAAKPTDELPASAEPGDESSNYAVEKLAADLNNPCGLTLRPNLPASGPYELYFSESGAGQVVRISTDKPAARTPVITGFPIGKLGEKPAYAVGPLGLEFLTRTKLAVGAGGLGKGEDVVRVYALPADATSLNYDQADHSVGPIPKDSRSETGEGTFFALAKIEDELDKALYVTSAGDPNQGWVLKASMSGNKLADLQPFIATRRVTGAGSPSAATVNPKSRSHYLLIGQMGEKGSDRDSIIGFYGPATGTPALILNTGLYDVTGLAYSPSGDLYALDFAHANPEAGGVYRIDAADVDDRQSARAVKIAAVERPTSLAFTPDGVLYVTAFGERPGANEQPIGQLLKITPGAGAPKL
jgi:hypothetical protein